MDIRFFKHHQIDKTQWDEHLSQCVNRMIYAQSKYLDMMAEDWSALIDESTGSIMPLFLKKKFGISYAYQPPFVQQTGVFSKHPLSPEIIRAFLNETSRYCQSVSLYLNHGNYLPELKKRTNLILNLDDSFENIKARFRKDLIPVGSEASLIHSEAEVREVLDLYKKYVLPKNKTLSEYHLSRFEKLSQIFLESKKAFAYKVALKSGRTLSTALFFIDDNRIYYVLAANTPKNRETGGNAFLLHEVIRKYAGSRLIFDFEGSELPGVRLFFSKFSPVEEPYYHFESDSLNLFQQGMKKLANKIKGK